MKTVLIYDQCGENELMFAVVEGDWSKFNNVYVNSMSDLSHELCEKLFPNDGKDLSIDLIDKFPIDDVVNVAQVVVIGFLP